MIELAYFGGFTHTEIAEMLETPIGTIKGRMRLGLEKMRTRLSRAEATRRMIGERHILRARAALENVGAYVLGALPP